MDQQRTNMFILTNQQYFPKEKIVFLKEKLSSIDESRFALLSAIDFKDPTTILVVSVFLGWFGIDRFMLGDTGMGVLKLLTFGGCGVLYLIDMLTISKKVQEINFNKVMTLI